MKKFTFKGVLDGFRSSVQPQSRPEQEIQEILRPEFFTMRKTFRHGFPNAPTALAYDPIQKLLAIGDKTGSLRILGRFGVDAHIKHDGDSACAVIQIEFLVNEGALVTATADDTLHLWNFRTKFPHVVQSLKFQRERITFLHLPVSTKWLYVGTEKGNTHIVNIDTFSLSGYIINWNKAIDPIRKTHPGPVVHLSDNPLDANKLLIGFESGQLVLWDMRNKSAEFRWQSVEPLRSVSWHHEGKHFVTSHTDGSLVSWPIRLLTKPQLPVYPHAKQNKEGKLESCKPIHKVELKTNRNGEQYTIFSGGLSMEKGGKSPCITVLVQGKSTTVLEMEHPVIDFITICESPWTSDMQEPYAIAVLLQNDLVLIDLLSSGYPTFESPYSMDLHESQVTCCVYLADCPSDLVPAFYSVGRSTSNRRSGYSEREWPINGGEWQPTSCSYSEIIITGHQDGSIKFWDASAGTLQVLYKLKTSKMFEKPRARSMDGSDEDPLAITQISLCAESRRLCLAGNSGHVILFKFRRAECSNEVLILEIPITYENFDDAEGSPECEFIPRTLPKQPDSTDVEKKNEGMLKIKSGPQRKPPGFQAQLVCLTPWTNGHPGQITSLSINSGYGLMAYGTEHGLVLVDIIQKVCLLNVASPDLYGAQDPYSRVPKSPKRFESSQKDEQTRSPSIDQNTASQNNSRPPSPAVDAIDELAISDEPITPEEEQKIIVTQCRRRSSAWKAFQFKKQSNKSVQASRKASLFTSEATMGLPISPSPEEKPVSTYFLPDEEAKDTGSNSPGETQDVDITNTQNVDTLPIDLNIVAESEAPVRPARTRNIEKRTQRLMSVPNAKTSKNEGKMGSEQKPRTSRVESSFAGNLIRRLSRVDKLDSSFSRSRSSSMSSLENITAEAITCLAFADSYTKKSDPTASIPTLWLGTSLGSVLTVSITLPDADSRKTQPVLVSILGGPIFRLKGSILSMSFLDCNGALIPYSFESWKDEFREAKERRERTPTKATANRMSPTLGSQDSFSDRQFIVLTSEKQSRVIALPSQNCVYRQTIVDTDFVVKAEIINIRDSVCLVCYASSGRLYTFSLPSLRLLLDVDFLPLSDLSFQTKCKQGIIIDPMLSIWGQQLIVHEDTNLISKTFSFSNKGHGLYLATPTELQKFTICNEFAQQYLEMLGELYIQHEMPEPPKESFFKGLFGVGVRNLDREELFGESSGKANRSVAKHIPGPNAAIQDLGSRATSASSEVSRAHQLMLERGDKLGQLEERTERMSNEAQQFSNSAHMLMNKYKDKKWYQL